MRPILTPMIAAGLALATVAAPSVAAALPILTASAGTTSSNGIGGCDNGGGTQTGSTAVAASQTCSDRFGVITGTGFASVGHIGATARAASFGGTSNPAQPTGGATYSDFLTFTSSDPTATTAEVSVNVVLDGLLNATGGDPNLFTPASASFDAFIVLTGFLELQEILKSDGSLFVGGNLGLVSGVLGPAPHGILRSPTLIVSLNQPIFFEMGLSVGSSATGPGASALSEFGHTFALPTGMDVFNLADGVTVNAGDYLINNRYFDPTAVSTGVPEPANWALTIAGFGLAGAMLRRRRAACA